MTDRLLVAHLLVRGFNITPPACRSPDDAPVSGWFAVAGAIRAGLKFKEPQLALAVLDAEHGSVTGASGTDDV